MTDESELARELCAGSAEAWRALFDRYSEAVWRSVARRVGSQAAEVADIVQETFLAAARGARTYDAKRGTLWVWLSGIARRQAALYYRRKQTRPLGSSERADTAHDAERAESSAQGPAELLLSAERAAAVRQALHSLPVEYETLLVGKYLDGLSLEELAETEESTTEAISSKLARARRAFREAFAQIAGTTDLKTAGSSA